MATNLKMDDGLLTEALSLSGFRTKREAVTLALQEFVAKRRQLQFLKLEGAVDFDASYDYRKQRNRE
jgi:Arc/MetJ family transcription regulator